MLIKKHREFELFFESTADVCVIGNDSFLAGDDDVCGNIFDIHLDVRGIDNNVAMNELSDADMDTASHIHSESVSAEPSRVQSADKAGSNSHS